MTMVIGGYCDEHVPLVFISQPGPVYPCVDVCAHMCGCDDCACARVCVYVCVHVCVCVFMCVCMCDINSLSKFHESSKLDLFTEDNICTLY